MRKHNYLVGYRGENQCVYGKRTKGHSNNWTDPLTLFQAKKLAKKIYGQSSHGKVKSVIYKLVEVKTN